MDELAMGGTNLTCFTGAAHNPWDTRRMTGGSSGGSAALVAAGVVPMAIGSDTGDSVRKPASYCGVVGVKPTYGRISRYGIIPYASSLDHVGYFTRSVEDACITLEVLAGRDDLDVTSSNRPVEHYTEALNDSICGKKIAILGNVVDSVSNPETVKLFNELVDKLKAAGAVVDMYHFDDKLMRAILPTYYTIANCEAASNHSNLDGIRFGVREDGADMQEIMTNSRTKGFGPLIRRRFVIGSYGLFEANQERIIDEINNDDKLSTDYLVAENYMAMANFSGDPSMTVPMGFEEGCPIGVNLTCPAWHENTMFTIAKAIEDITGLRDLQTEVK